MSPHKQRRYCVECFYAEEPVDENDAGDMTAHYGCRSTAEKWILAALKHGRFKCIILWDGAGREWLHIDTFRADDFSFENRPSKEIYGKAAAIQQRKPSSLKRRYSRDDIRQLRQLAKSMPLSKLAEAMHRSEPAIRAKARSLGIRLGR